MSYNLTQMIDEIEMNLQDTANAYWSTDVLTRAIRHALADINQKAPRLLVTTMNDSDAVREYSLSSITNILRVVAVWWPYTATRPEYPPNWVPWTMLTDTTLFLDTDDQPNGTQVIRIYYLARHTINGLDSETTSTMDKETEEGVILGATAYALLWRAIDSMGEINTDRDTPNQFYNTHLLLAKRFDNWLEAKQRDLKDVRISGLHMDKWDKK